MKIGAPTVQRRLQWGDWHFALALRDALERLGQQVSVDCRHDFYRPTAHLDDVVLCLRGLSEVDCLPTQTNVLWVISHPDDVTPGELRSYDLAFAASTSWSQEASSRSGRLVEPLLQCTDPRLFHPRSPEPPYSHTVLSVANARGLRPSVAAVLEAGLVPAVYGERWEGLLPDGALQSTRAPIEDVPRLYSSAGVVLNDHWDDMRRHGFLSNRLFDLAATEARALSDHLPEIGEVFGDAVATFEESTDVRALVEALLADSPEAQAERARVGALVREQHTFDARAATLVDRVNRFRHQGAGPAAGHP